MAANSDYLMGGCVVSDGCGIKCARFRPDDDSSVICGYCNHDISAHSILGFIQDGKVQFLPSAVAEPNIALQIPKDSTDEERKQLFRTKQKATVNNKRKSSGDQIDSRRSVGPRSTPSPPRTRNMMLKMIMMERRDPVPQTDFDHLEMNENCEFNYHLTTLDNLHRFLKLNVSYGEFYAK